jgi:hypothetical protein
VIIVNTHGEILPVPNGYTKEEWVDKISEAMLTRRVTWVHVAGYPFYYVKHESGASETWGENGFKHFMNNINKGNVNCWPPQSETMLVEHSNAMSDIGSLGNWGGVPGNWTMYDLWYAELGRPLKWSDFKDYLILPLYEYNDTSTLDVYLTGAVIAYVKAGQRYLTDYGCGAYVHIGTYRLYDHNGDLLNYDLCKGILGTAAALWVEANRFKSSASSWSKSAGGRVWNATVFAYPTVIGFEKLDSSYIKVRLGFGIHGIYKFPQEREEGARFEEARFGVWIDSEDWSDVRMKADINNPALSKQTQGFGTELSGLNTEREEEFRGLATNTIIYIGSLIPGVGYFFDAIGGLMLLGQWGGFAVGGSGIDEYSTEVYIWYDTISLHSQPIDGYVYAETSSIVIVDVRIPTSTRSGWMVLPLTYYVNVALETGILGDPLYWVGPIQKTIQIATFFDRGEGQKDAGLPGDAGNDYASARTISFPTWSYGYLDGDADPVDCYNFALSSETRIKIELNPPPYVDFNLELKSPSGDTWASQKGPGITEYIELNAEAGLWKIKISKVYGSGVYRLQLGSAGGGGCPTLFIWNGTCYIEEATLQIHSDNDITLKHKIQQKPIPKAELYLLKLAELDNFTSHVDQVKLYAVDSEGKPHLCPLLLAYHNAQGSATSKLLFDDDNRIDLKPAQEIKLYFLKTIAYENTEYLIFEINGYNAKQP